MTKEEKKELLLKDLCARLPYGVIALVKLKDKYDDIVKRKLEITEGNVAKVFNIGNNNWYDCKPYLRPISSMTKEEDEEYRNIDNQSYSCPKDYAHIPAQERIDWLNAHHFDYRGLIEKDLAIKVTEENNPYKEYNYDTKKI